MSTVKLDAVRQQIARDFPNDDINVTFENDTAFVRGTVQGRDRGRARDGDRSTLGKTVNLLRVDVPPVEPQSLLKVRFANVDRARQHATWASTSLSGAFNQTTAIGTGQSPQPATARRTLSLVGSRVNILLLRPDINLAAAITALQSKRLLEMLAEPNLLAISGKQASFLAGGEFPFPMVQPGVGRRRRSASCGANTASGSTSCRTSRRAAPSG